MVTIETSGRLVVPDVIELPTEAGHETTALPGTACRLDLEALFEGDVSRLADFATRFWRRVEGRTLDECCPWTGQVFQKTGYGLVHVSLPRGARKSLYAHRVAWTLATRMAIPERVLVRHWCRTRACCNPTHLYLGDYCGNELELQVVE
jgi:hypothetical protein